MERLAYILDTNTVADYLNHFEPTTARIKQVIQDGNVLYLCQPVIYEVLRGLIKTGAIRKRHAFETQFVPQLSRLSIVDGDWQQAAQFWADASNIGKQLSDVDLLIAAIAHRMGGVVVSADADFDALPVRRENWRER